VIRFSPAGERIDASPILTGSEGYLLSVGTNGREFLLAFTIGSNWWQFPPPNLRDVQAIRLDASGAPMDAAPIDIAGGANDQAAPHVVSDGTDFMVVYQEHFGTHEELRAKRVLRSGVLAGTTATQSGVFVATGTFPSAVTPQRRGGYIVAFTSESSLTLSTVTIDRDGHPTSEPQQVAESDAEIAGVALASSSSAMWLSYGRTAPEPEFANVPRVFVRRLYDSTRRRAIGVRRP
jgi:hypothetical protein